MNNIDKDPEAFMTISQVWSAAGLDFKRTALMFTPPGNTPEELRTDLAFKQLAKEELEKEGIQKPTKES